MSKSWKIAPYDEGIVKQICAELKVPVLVGQVLASRGFRSGEEASTFLNAGMMDLHAPDLLPGVSEAARRVVDAVSNGRRVTIYGDYDVDGVTATSILWHCLKLLGAKVDYYIPLRVEEGYGLNCDAVRQLHADDPDRLLISVDCGITSVREAELARELGLELIITDHHTLPETLPDAAVLVHPRLTESPYPFADLCGAGVAFKLAWGICQLMGDGRKASPHMREFLMSAVTLAAIGTIADVVPLLGENRILVQYGLASLSERSSIGLKALLRVSSLTGRDTITAEDIGFNIAPRINAAGRLGQARLAVELLTTGDPDRARTLADYVDELNRNRRTVERRIFKQAKELVEEHPEWLEAPTLVLAHPEWHPGVIGIVASRVAERFERSTVLIALNRQGEPAQGSGRSFGGFDLHSGLAACADHLVTFGGHKVAAGLRVMAENIDAFRQTLCDFASTGDRVEIGVSPLGVDAEVRLADLTWQAVTRLEALGPFGASNGRPVFVTSKVEVVGRPKKMGEGERHLDIRVRHYGTAMRAIAFGQAEWADEIVAVGGPISICFAPTINRFRGSETVEMHLIDWKPWQATTAAAEAASSFA